MNEEWKQICVDDVMYNYEVSNQGRVRNKTNKKILKQTYDKDGYCKISLYCHDKRKHFRVHRLVGIMFIPNPNNLPMINHKDENKSNNCVDNLEWCTAKYNTNYGTGLERRAESQRGLERSEESKRKMSESQKGRVLSEEHKRKIGNSMLGKNQSEEKKQKCRDAKMGGKNPKAKKVKCLNTGEVFESVSDAVRWCHGDKSSICNAAKGKLKTSGKHPITGEKLQWEYI